MILEQQIYSQINNRRSVDISKDRLFNSNSSNTEI